MASTVGLTLFPTPKAGPTATAPRSPVAVLGQRPIAVLRSGHRRWLRSRAEERAAADQARADADQERAARRLAEAQVAELQAELLRLRGESA